jgi:phosphatidate cytidylyltransferase
MLFVAGTMAPLAYAAFKITMGTYRIEEEYFFMIAPLLLFFVFVIVVSRSGSLFENTSAMAVSLLLFGCGGLFALTVINNSPMLLLCIFILLWTNDTFAYLTGSRFGKTKLAPLISPGKTWEGLIGGVLACIIVGIALSFWQIGVSMQSWVIIAFMVSVFGTSGDLLQSLFKRHFGVKDSGSLLPGHGGFWDRFDSFFGCIPFIAVYLNLFG